MLSRCCRSDEDDEVIELPMMGTDEEDDTDPRQCTEGCEEEAVEDSGGTKKMLKRVCGFIVDGGGDLSLEVGRGGCGGYGGRLPLRALPCESEDLPLVDEDDEGGGGERECSPEGGLMGNVVVVVVASKCEDTEEVDRNVLMFSSFQLL